MTTEGVSPTSAVRISEDVVFCDLEGESVILNLETGVYFGLDHMGTRIWHLLQEHGSLQKVLDALLEEYEVPEGQCAQDVYSFITQLREKGLIEVGNK